MVTAFAILAMFVLSTLLALSQAQQLCEMCADDWCLDSETGTMMCIAGSKLHQKALDAFQQCSHLAESGSDMPAGRSIFGLAQTKRSVEERQASAFWSGECPPFSELGVAVNDPNPLQGAQDSMTDCVLGAMGFIAPAGNPKNKRITKALDTIDPSVLENFSMGTTTKEKWDNCRNGSAYGNMKNGFGNYMKERAAQCGDAYTEEEAKSMMFYGARSDAFQCLTIDLRNTCWRTFHETADSAWVGQDGSGIEHRYRWG